MKELIRIGIVGGGISGLTTAYLLHREAGRRALPLEVRLLEKSNRLGGVIHTQIKDDYLFEWGPENFVPFKPKILELIREVGLSNQLIGSNDQKRRTYVCAPDGLYPLPDGLAFLTPVNPVAFFKTRLLSPGGKLRAMLEPAVPRSRGELSVKDFLARRLGREFVQRVAEPLISSIYGGDIERLSASAALASTHLLEQKYGSLWRGMRQTAGTRNGKRGSMFYALRNGMSELVQALSDRLPPDTLRLDCGELEISRNGSQFLVRGKGIESRFDGLAICTPAPAASRLLNSLIPDSAPGLREISYSSTTLIYLAYSRQRFSHPLHGFGFVAQRDAAQVLDACTWVSSKFEGRCPDDHVLLRCAVHDGRWKRSTRADDALVEDISKELKRLLKINCEPSFWRVQHLPKAMPQPVLRHSQHLARVTSDLARLPGLFLTGAYSGGVGLPDCVSNAAGVSENLLRRWFPVDQR